ncbi:MAG: hypothetical protein VB046_06860 [Paludibacter sp.]|nr:hypothetical protein [Paludibacter sp.]
MEDYPEIPGWYEPDDEIQEPEYKDKQVLPSMDVSQDDINNYRVAVEGFYRRNYLIISFLQFLIIIILLIKILKSK